MTDPVDRPLGAYRVVELPGPEPLLAGKTFADLGADVIKVEPPGGDPARTLPPRLEDGPGAGTGLAWAAWSLGKRSVTADLERPEGRALVRRLLATADVLLEALPPGRLAALGLDPEELRRDHPGLVITSLSPFGQDGPYAGWRGSDLVHFAMSGYLHMTGPADGPPIKPSAPYQSFLHGSMHAVAATLLALRRRRRTGEGARVDVALRDTGVWMLTHTYQHWDLARVNLRRRGSARDMGSTTRLRAVYRCKDGYVVWMFLTGHIGARGMQALVRRMADEGMAPPWLQELDWSAVDLMQDSELPPKLEAAFAPYFATKTKAELLAWAIQHGVMLAPAQTLREVGDDPHLAARDAWRTVTLRDGAPPVRVPGPPVRMGGARWEPRGRPPEPGQHNAALYGELGLTPAELAALRSAGAV
ncbi:MAG TPA: CoA transferase [Dehalococcoidia bacterium]